MSRPATDRLKINPPLGMMPALQYLPPDMLRIDSSYQRTLDTEASMALVRAIAQHWNWDLCQPLVVARRVDGALFVIDGQHRLAAARMRGDIAQLPAVVVQYASAADEAASFVHLNQQRRPLTKIDLFKAAVASGDSEAQQIVAALAEAGLTIAPHSNPTAWKPGMVSNIGGIEQCWRMRGGKITRVALKAMAEGLDGQVLRYAGTLLPGIAAVVAIEIASTREDGVDPQIWPMLIDMITDRSQDKWRGLILQHRADYPNLNFSRASEAVFGDAWRAWLDDAFDFGRETRAPVLGESRSDCDEDYEADCEDGDGNEAAVLPAPRPAAFDVTLKDSARAGLFKPAPPKPASPKPEPVIGKPPAVNWGLVSQAARGVTKKPVFKPDSEGKAWCGQCDRRRKWPEITACRDKHCPFGEIK